VTINRFKIKSFSILELIVVMLISSIILSLSFTVIKFINEHLTHVKRQKKSVYELYKMKATLAEDIYLSEEAILTAKNKLLLKGKEDISYTVKDSTLIRCKSGICHEAEPTVTALKFSTKSNNTTDEVQRVDGITVELRLNGHSFKLNFEKEYSCTTIIESYEFN